MLRWSLVHSVVGKAAAMPANLGRQNPFSFFVHTEPKIHFSFIFDREIYILLLWRNIQVTFFADIVCILVLSNVQKTESEIFSTFVKLTFQGFEF